MRQTSGIKLSYSCIMNVPLQTYANDFIFVVNRKEFKTSRLISDLLSPIICQIHSTDPTFNQFHIDTKNQGHFSYILDLANFSLNSVPTDELPFISEVIEILGNDTISQIEQEQEHELTKDNVFSNIYTHEKFSKFYFKRLQQEIEFISSHFYEICENKKEELMSLQLETLESILNNPKLVLNDEDQLLLFINELYKQNNQVTSLYETVYFEQVTSKSVSEFVDIFDPDDITKSMWLRLSNRIKQEITKVPTNLNERYVKKLRGTLFPFTGNNEFKGIVNYLYTKSNGNIDNEISFSASSNNNENGTDNWKYVHNVAIFDDRNKGFFTKDVKNSWICLDFKKYKIIPTHYTIRTNQNSNPFPRSWVIEVCNDGCSWEIVDRQEDCASLNGYSKMQTFKIKKDDLNAIRYIRIRQIQAWSAYNSNYLGLESFEIYGSME